MDQRSTHILTGPFRGRDRERLLPIRKPVILLTQLRGMESPNMLAFDSEEALVDFLFTSFKGAKLVEHMRGVIVALHVDYDGKTEDVTNRVYTTAIDRVYEDFKVESARLMELLGREP